MEGERPRVSEFAWRTGSRAAAYRPFAEGTLAVYRVLTYCKDFLILRLGVENAEAALNQDHVRPFDITGRAMKGWVMVAPEGFEKRADLKRWLDQAHRFVKTLPAK